MTGQHPQALRVPPMFVLFFFLYFSLWFACLLGDPSQHPHPQKKQKTTIGQFYVACASFPTQKPSPYVDNKVVGTLCVCGWVRPQFCGLWALGVAPTKSGGFERGFAPLESSGAVVLLGRAKQTAKTLDRLFVNQLHTSTGCALFASSLFFSFFYV